MCRESLLLDYHCKPESVLFLERLCHYEWRSRLSLLKGAGHAVLRTLYSRAHRIGLDETSWGLERLSEASSFGCLAVVIGALPVKPELELLVLLKEKFEGFADDVGLVAADELGVFVQVEFDAFFNSDLDHCVLWLLWGCFQNWQLFSPFGLQIVRLGV